MSNKYTESMGLTSIRLTLLILCILANMSDSEEPYKTMRRYDLHSGPLRWTDARIDCTRNGGTLATLYDRSTLPDVLFSISHNLTSTDTVWIGLHRVSSAVGMNNSWTWDKAGDNVTWFDWDTKVDDVINEVTNALSCVAASAAWPCKWRILPCHTTLPYICQYKQDEKCRFDEHDGMHIAANDYVFLYGKSVEDCLAYCVTNLEQSCRSFEYNVVDTRCLVNTGNKWTLPTYYRSDKNWVYYHRTCNYIPKEEMVTSITPSPSSTFQEEKPVATPMCYTSIPVIQPSYSNVVMTSIITLNVTVTQEINVTHDVTNTHNATLMLTTWFTETITSFETSTLVVYHTPLFNFTFDNETDPVQELVEIGEQMKEKNKILSKTSVHDDRPSATYVGYIGIVFICLVLGSIVLFDLVTLCASKKQKKRKSQSIRRHKREYIVTQHGNKHRPSDDGLGHDTNSITVITENETHVKSPAIVAINWDRVKANQDLKKRQNEGVHVTQVGLPSCSWSKSDARIGYSPNIDKRMPSINPVYDVQDYPKAFDDLGSQRHWRPLVWGVEEGTSGQADVLNHAGEYDSDDDEAGNDDTENNDESVNNYLTDNEEENCLSDMGSGSACLEREGKDDYKGKHFNVNNCNSMLTNSTRESITKL